MATQTPAGDDGTLNGATAVDIVPAPASSQQHVVLNITICNIDTVSQTVTVQKVSGGGTRVIAKRVLAVNDTLNIDSRVTLDDTSSKIQAKMGGAATTTNPDWTTSWFVNA